MRERCESDASMLLDSEDADYTVAAIEDEQDESKDKTHDITENLLNIISPKPSLSNNRQSSKKSRRSIGAN